MADASQEKRHWIDKQPCPVWGDGPDGRPTKLDGDDRLPSLYRQWLDDACVHPKSVTVHRHDSLGRDQYYEHCEHCGLALSSAIAHSKIGVVADYTVTDMSELSDRYTAARKQSLERLKAQAAERAQPENRGSYDDYLRSDRWKKRSAKILARAKGVCEGCLTNPASVVHHLTYEHIGEEFAFELVALCDRCHHRVHGRDL